MYCNGKTSLDDHLPPMPGLVTHLPRIYKVGAQIHLYMTILLTAAGFLYGYKILYTVPQLFRHNDFLYLHTIEIIYERGGKIR